MPVRRLSPEECLDMMQGEGYAYVDVRSVPEFETGHPEGAYNVPLMHMGPGGMSPNPEFLTVMERNFPKDARIAVGCRSGGRSIQAASLLERAGFTHVVEQRAGFEGTRDASGRPEPGWKPKGLPASREASPDRTYEALKARTGG